MIVPHTSSAAWSAVPSSASVSLHLNANIIGLSALTESLSNGNKRSGCEAGRGPTIGPAFEKREVIAFTAALTRRSSS